MRSGLYVAVGLVLVGFASFWVNVVLPGRPPGAVAVPVVTWLLVPIGLLPLRWRIAIDEQGVWRRRLWRWELWSWEDFGSGRLKYGYYDHSLVDPGRPRFRRTLSLTYLTEADNEQVWQAIAAALQMPEVPPLPEAFEFRYGELWSQPVRMDASGLTIGKRCRARTYAWSEVESLELKRQRHERPDFRELILKLPGRKLHLHRGQQHGIETRNWKGVEPDALAGYLLAHVPVDRQMVMATAGPAVTERELETRLREARKNVREVFQMRVVFRLMYLGLLLYSWWDRDWRMLLVSCVGVVMIEGTIRFLSRITEESCAELERQQEALLPAQGENAGEAKRQRAPAT